MRLFNRNKGNQPVQSTDQQYMTGQPSQGSRIDWKRALPRLAAALLLAAVLVFGIIWIVGAFTKDEPAPQDKKKPAIAQRNSSDSKPAGDGASNAGSSAETENTQSASDTTTSRSTTARTPAGSTIANSGKLADAGPGETLALFLATTIISAAAYNTFLRRQHSR